MSIGKVLIAGGGIGGLCVAQGLKRAGISVEVFERDQSPNARAQGYRFRIDPQGHEALRACLPDELFDLYQRTSNKPSSPPVGAFDHRMNLVYRIPGIPSGAVHTAVNRLTLRQVLLQGLESEIRFGMEVSGVEQDSECVGVRFVNGEMAEGDLLIAADGTNSVLRRTLLPAAEVADLGYVCIYGRTPVDEETLTWMPEALQGGFTPVVGPDASLALAMFRMREHDPRVDAVHDYLMWVLVFAATPLPSSSAELHEMAVLRIRDWHPDLHRLVGMADVPATFPITLRTSRPVEPWPASRVTFLGDSIHTMTPAGGVGANTAMRDAALLTRLLTSADRGELPLLEAISQYECEMREYGFAAVQHSLQSAANLYRAPLRGQP